MRMLETERLILRKLTADDAEALYRIYHEPGVLEYFAHGPPESIDAERADIQRHLLYYERHGFGLWATTLRESGELIGRCGLLAQQVDDAQEIEVAYLLSPRFWGRGLASEAARAIRDFAFYTLGHSHLVSIIHPGNRASKRVATAIGMAFSKTSRLYNMEVEVFSITRSPSHAAPSAQLTFPAAPRS
jgi:ribosomal-protein-alanine N-acetyltransferase